MQISTYTSPCKALLNPIFAARSVQNPWFHLVKKEVNIGIFINFFAHEVLPFYE